MLLSDMMKRAAIRYNQISAFLLKKRILISYFFTFYRSMKFNIKHLTLCIYNFFTYLF